MARFAAIQLARLAGVGCVALGMLVATGRVWPGLPGWAGYAILAAGLFDVFVVPRILIRKWRTPR